MAINLITSCKDCAHAKVCKNYTYPETFVKKLINLKYGTKKANDADWQTMAKKMRLKVSISCADFDKAYDDSYWEGGHTCK